MYTKLKIELHFKNRLYVFGKGMAPFFRYGQVKANSEAKELHITNINTKGCTPNGHMGLPLNSSFLQCQTTTIWTPNENNAGANSIQEMNYLVVCLFANFAPLLSNLYL